VELRSIESEYSVLVLVVGLPDGLKAVLCVLGVHVPSGILGVLDCSALCAELA
jgi:hypothetical protein